MINLGFDKIFVINLPNRPDRREKFDELFNGLEYHYINAISGVDVDLKRLIGDKTLSTSFYDPDGTLNKNVIGCSLSHLKCWETFQSTQMETCLIFEDDVHYTKNIIDGTTTSKHWNDIKDEMDGLDWDIIFLGKKTKEVEGKSVSNSFCKPKWGAGLFGAHSYVINKKSVGRLIEKYKPIQYAVDVYMDMLLDDMNIFALKKSLFRQHTDIYLHDKKQPEKVDSDTFYNGSRLGQYKIIKVDNSVHSVELVTDREGLVKLNFKL